MKIHLVVVVAALVASANPALAYTMNRCSLARKMAALGEPRDQLAKWTCIAQHESNYRTNVVGPPNADGSKDYGIFQINDRYWCQSPNSKKSLNLCGISCTDLLSNDITSSVRCAHKVLRAQGWFAWSTWKDCDGALPSIDPCFK